MYELTNDERAYLGLEPVECDWDRVEIDETHIVYFEGNRVIPIRIRSDTLKH
ncbi:hypothetical protein AGMMS50289_21670 [Betaproteobacteria bacterium]|nr:hypothetical protein AGMMS50289_21670 [Betaproteobacteria bacterium]